MKLDENNGFNNGDDEKDFFKDTSEGNDKRTVYDDEEFLKSISEDAGKNAFDEFNIAKKI